MDSWGSVGSPTLWTEILLWVRARVCVCVWACECVSDIRAPHCNTAKKIYHTFTESLAANTSRHVPLCYL